jgi:DNA uptake protein ComE-like DNA-binding protein
MRHATLVSLALLVLSLALVASDSAGQQTPPVPGAGTIQQMAKKIDLNKATDAELKSLPSLNSDDLVKKIKAARPFKQVADLKKIVPEPVFEQIKNLVMVTP